MYGANAPQLHPILPQAAPTAICRHRFPSLVTIPRMVLVTAGEGERRVRPQPRAVSQPPGKAQPSIVGATLATRKSGGLSALALYVLSHSPAKSSKSEGGDVGRCGPLRSP